MVDHLLSTTTTTTAPSKIRAEERNAETPAPGVTGYLVPSPFWAHWRGRYGSTEDEQARIWSMIDPEASKSSIRQDTIGSMSSADEKKEVSLVFRTWEGEKRTVSAFTGDSLLDVARREDLPSMEGTCEGNLGMSASCLRHSLILITSHRRGFPITQNFTFGERVETDEWYRMLNMSSIH